MIGMYPVYMHVAIIFEVIVFMYRYDYLMSIMIVSMYMSFDLMSIIIVSMSMHVDIKSIIIVSVSMNVDLMSIIIVLRYNIHVSRYDSMVIKHQWFASMHPSIEWMHQ